MRMASAGFQCVPTGSKKSIPAGLGQRDDVAVSDGGICRPQIMKTIINAVLSQQETIKEGTSAYLDDIYVNEDVVSSSRVRSQLAKFGLICKNN